PPLLSDLHSFPTRRSSDLADADWRVARRVLRTLFHLTYVRGGMNHGMPGEVEASLATAVEHVDLRRVADAEERAVQGDRGRKTRDRKSTRLNSSHQIISYA